MPVEHVREMETLPVEFAVTSFCARRFLLLELLRGGLVGKREVVGSFVEGLEVEMSMAV